MIERGWCVAVIISESSDDEMRDSLLAAVTDAAEAWRSTQDDANDCYMNVKFDDCLSL